MAENVEFAPDYVLTVLKTLRTARLKALNFSRRPLPDPRSPIVISVIKDEIDRLADFLLHYRQLGVERFAFVDNGSTDGCVEYLKLQPDVDLFQCVDSFNWMKKQGWISKVIEKYGGQRWFIYVDADEHLVFDGVPQYTLRDLVVAMEQRGLSRVRGILLDMYPDGPLLQSSYERDGRLANHYPFFDRAGYVEARFREIISVKGGPRQRVFGVGEPTFRPEMSKYPLFMSRPGEYMVNPHHLWPYDDNFHSDRYIGILHYKFLPGLITRVRQAIEAKNYWDDSFEYRCYLKIFERHPDVSLHHAELSERYIGPQALIDADLIKPIDWSVFKKYSPLQMQIETSFRLCRAGMLSTPTGARTGSGWKIQQSAAAGHPNGVQHSAAGVSPPKTEAVVALDVRLEWADIYPHQSAELLPAGKVRINQTHSTPGVVTKAFKLAKSGLLRVRFVGKCGVSLSRPHLRMTDPDGVRLGPDVPLSDGAQDCSFFVQRGVECVKLYVIVFKPVLGYEFSIDALTVNWIDSEGHFAAVSRPAGGPVIASLATIPKRREMLRDCVESLLLQCDKVRVFLNEYPDVPEFLHHPRVEIRRSQDWDDKGDAGKFAWIGEPDPPGYRLIVDDDLIFPPDFAARMLAALGRHDNRAICALHGIILRQPITEYYNPDSRIAFHFQNELTSDRICHVLGSNALAFHSATVKMTWPDFMFRNMADIWLAQYAQKNDVPMIAVARPSYWVRQNQQPGGFETIYDHSLNKTRSRFDSSLIQDAVAKRIAPLTIKANGRYKLALCIAASQLDDLNETVASWRTAKASNIEMVLLVALDGDNQAALEAIRSYKSDREFHHFTSASESSGQRLRRMLGRASEIGADGCVFVFAGSRFEGADWAAGIAERLSGAAAIGCVIAAGGDRARNMEGDRNEAMRPAAAIANAAALRVVPPPELTATDLTSAFSDWCRDLLLRASQPKDVVRLLEMIVPAVPAEIGNARALAPSSDRSLNSEPVKALSSINKFFERVVVLNLDRRPDRWAAMADRLERVGMTAERFAAVDGGAAATQAEYELYAAGSSQPTPTGVRKITTSREYYLDYDSQNARLAYLENWRSRKAIESPGAWGYLRSMERVLEQALVDQVDSILVLDDDCIFHKNAGDLFAAAASETPADWMLLQLGNMQHEWSPEWIQWHSAHLFKTNGYAVGSHAVGIRFDAIPFLLDNIKRMDMPYDTGALAAATLAFRDRAFVVYPNIAIQELSDSDINTSAFLAERGQAEALAKFRWTADDYDQ